MTARTAPLGRQLNSKANDPKQSTWLKGQDVKVALPVFIYLMTVVLPIHFQAGPLQMTTMRLFLMFMLVPLTFQLLSGKYGKVILTDYMFFAHLIWAAVALYHNNPDRMVEQVGSVGMEFLGGYLIGRAFIRTPAQFIALAKMLVLLVCISTLLAIYESKTGHPLILETIRKLPGVGTVARVMIEKRLNLFRAQVVFAHPIHYGLFCSVAFSMCFVALEGFYSTGRRIITSAIVGMSGMLALSSGALLAIVLQIGLISWFLMFRSISKRWWLLVGLFAMAYIAIDLLSNRSPMRVFMSYATFSAHNAYWRSIIFEWGMKNIYANPVFGIGLNDWVRPDFMHSGSMDNFWLVMGVRYGVLGFVTLAIGYVFTLSKVMRRKFDNDVLLLNLRRAWVFTFLGLTFTLSTVHVWTAIYSFVFFFFGAGVWLTSIQPKSAETPDNPESGAVAPTDDNPYTRFPTRPIVRRTVNLDKA